MVIYEVSVDKDGNRRSIGFFVKMQDAAEVAAVVNGAAGAVEVYDNKKEWIAIEAADRRTRVLAKLSDEERALLGVS